CSINRTAPTYNETSPEKRFGGKIFFTKPEMLTSHLLTTTRMATNGSVMNPQTSMKISVVVFLLMVACSRLDANEAIKASPQSITPSFALTATNTPISVSTSTPLPTVSTTKKPSETPDLADTPTMESIVAATVTPVPPITNQQPSISELGNYLTNLSLEEDVFGHEIKITYEDVNGDGAVDLVVSDYLFVGVFIWQEDHYTGAFIYQGYPWKYDPGSRVTLEDWTGDGISEVIFDFRDDTGGTGVRGTDWTRYVIHCQQNEITCNVVWAVKSGSFYEGYGLGGVALLQTDINQVHEFNETPTLEILTESFAIYSGGIIPHSSQIGDGILSYSGGRKAENSPPYYPLELESLKVYTSTLDTYAWNGNEFEWQETTIQKPAMYTDSLAVLESINENNQIASILAGPNNDAGLKNDICQLFINGNATGLPFGCKDNFTVVEWRDITGDNKDDLVVVVYSGLYDNAGFQGDGNFTHKNCIHQRALVYQQANSLMKKVADVTGCVVQSDLFGVRFEDIDGDGQVEILAASGWFTSPRCASVFSALGADGRQQNCWYEFGYQTEIYKWNGSEFIYRGLQD
ncbi:MAG: VCBS repeat-containing protein, partial [Chloroflexi bacterium]|nr:VCBS repeat-containing protein [Chloroflexota bacterium]